MNLIESYKSRFYNLLESTMGDVKPLIVEQGIYNLRQTAESQNASESERKIAREKIAKYLKNWASEFEVLKSQRGYNKPNQYCDPCKFTLTGTLSGDIKAGKTCLNYGIYNKQWNCTTVDLLSTLVREYNTSFNATDTDRINILNSIKKIPEIKYKSILGDPHFLLTIAEIGTAFIPIAGPFISAGIGLGNAYLYYNEGNKKKAAIAGLFSLLPFIGPAIKVVTPAISKLGVEGVEQLGSKVATNQLSNLSKTELEVLDSVVKNKKIIEQTSKDAAAKLDSVKDIIAKYKNSFIQKNGQEAFIHEVKNFLYYGTPKEAFIIALSS